MSWELSLENMQLPEIGSSSSSQYRYKNDQYENNENTNNSINTSSSNVFKGESDHSLKKTKTSQLSPSSIKRNQMMVSASHVLKHYKIVISYIQMLTVHVRNICICILNTSIISVTPLLMSFIRLCVILILQLFSILQFSL